MNVVIAILIFIALAMCYSSMAGKPQPVIKTGKPQPVIKTNTVTITVTNRLTITNVYYGFVNLNHTNIAAVFSFPLLLCTNGGAKVEIEFYEFDAGTNVINSTNLIYTLSTNSLFIDTAIAPVD